MVEEERVREIVDEAVEPLRDSLWGPKHPGTGERISTAGLDHKVDVMYRQALNGGGINAEMKFDRRTKLIMALIGLIQVGLITFLTAVVT